MIASGYLNLFMNFDSNERCDIMQLPTDPNILLSYVNTMLRDKYSDLDKLCSDQEINRSHIEEKLMSINYIYSKELNRFIAGD